MESIDGRIVLSPTDLSAYLACPHLTRLELAAARGEIARPTREDPELDVLAKRGEVHERRHLERLRAEGRQIVEIDRGGAGLAALHAAAEATTAAMRAGVEVIYQATFFDGRWRGHADFLCRVEQPSRLGSWSYEVTDAKLARRVKAAAILQLCSYSEQVARVQGTAPEHIHVLGGDEVSRAHRLSDYAAYFRAVKTSFEESVDGPRVQTYPEPVPHCGICRWSEVCVRRRRQDDHLSLVAGMRRSQARRLVAAGVPTLTTLASSSGTAVPGVGVRAFERLRGQARLQLTQRQTGEVRYELTQPQPGLGLAALPSPSPADLFFDMEGDPFAGEDGLEYLFGVVEVADGQPRYHTFWAHDRAEEREAFERFVDLVMARLDDHPDLHVYHYGSYEPAAVRRLMGAHATRERAVDRLLRGAVFVDLHQVVRQGVVVSQESYSIKKLEPLYMAARDAAITDAGSSIVAYERWLETGEQLRLDDIAEYNQADCESTWLLRDWLERRRAEAERNQHGEPLSRPQLTSGEPGPEQAAAEADTEALVAKLTASIAEEPDDRTPAESATWLLAQLLDWHRREDKPEWWAHFARLEQSDDELVDDPDSIGELEYAGTVGEVGRSLVHRYRFRPGQEHKLSVGDSVLDPRTGARCGTVCVLDDADGILDLRRGRGSAVAHPTSVIPDTPRPTTVLRQALARVGSSVAEHGIDGPGPYRAVRDLVMRRPPWLGELPLGQPLQPADERPLDAARRLARRLDGTCLPVQGPPGSGKTFTAAHMIVDLVRSGRRVAITATTHKAITNLVDAACSCARESGRRLSVVQKGDEDRASTSPMVEVVGDNNLVVASLEDQRAQVVAGTPWLFARPQLAGAVDVLFVDEAGQMSLANVVAAGAVADSIVLLGDPQQLAQPSKGAHPPGAGVSALEHLLGDHATIPADRGLFLPTTWRLHPAICDFVSEAFYEGRLQPDPTCCIQRLDEGSWAGGAGVRWRPVHHAGNRTTSAEEVSEVAAGVEVLMGRQWTDRDGRRQRIGLDDILVVSPYNAQVARLRTALPPGARVGTVDRFQGQEAPVVIFSLATSSTADLPRSVEFLYSLNRLNVAVSRARALVVLVCCPDLLRVRCRTPREMRLANALCRLAELAGATGDTGDTGGGRERLAS